MGIISQCVFNLMHENWENVLPEVFGYNCLYPCYYVRLIFILIFLILFFVFACFFPDIVLFVASFFYIICFV